MNEPQDRKRPDGLVDLYRQASAQDAGPSAASTAHILARARAQALHSHAPGTGPAATPAGLQSAAKQDHPFSGEAANDRRWWLQALGSLAAIGLVSWLALQHLNEPGAPQLDSAPHTTESAPASTSAPASPPAADMAASPSSAKIRSEVAPIGQGASSSAAGADMPNAGPAPAIAPAPQAERRMAPASAAAQAPDPAPPPMPAPAAAVAPASPAAPAPLKNRAAEDIRALERPAPRSPAAAAVAPAAAPAMPARQALPPCGPDLDAQELAEQQRRIQAYDKAVAAGMPLPEWVPVCRPRHVHEAEPVQPLDSR